MSTVNSGTHRKGLNKWNCVWKIKCFSLMILVKLIHNQVHLSNVQDVLTYIFTEHFRCLARDKGHWLQRSSKTGDDLNNTVSDWDRNFLWMVYSWLKVCLTGFILPTITSGTHRKSSKISCFNKFYRLSWMFQLDWLTVMDTRQMYKNTSFYFHL